MKPLLLSLLLASAATFAQGQNLGAGSDLFAAHCATCHGRNAQGAGPMAPVLLLQPSDLTQLETKAGGIFPRAGVIAKIDGRDPLLSHGSPMPVFGGFFEGRGVAMRGEDGVLIMTSQPIIDLIGYLESIQAVPE